MGSTAFWGILSTDAGQPQSRREISYDSQWILSDFDHGIEVRSTADEEDRRRRRIRDDGTGAFRESERAAPAFTRESLPFIPPPSSATPGTERRPRNWILPTLDDDDVESPRWDRDERESSGWGWLADEVEQRRQEEAAQQRQREEASAETDDEFRVGSLLSGQNGDQRAPRLGVLAFEPDQPEERTGGAPRDIDQLAQMSPEEIRQLAMSQPDAFNGDATLNHIDPWGTSESAASPWLSASPDSLSAFENSLFAADSSSRWGEAMSPGSLAADFSAWQRPANPETRNDRSGASLSAMDRFERSPSASSANSFGDHSSAWGAGSFQQTRFGASENDMGNWSGNWAGGTEWQENPVQGTIGSVGESRWTTEPAGQIGASRSISPMHDDGWLATR